MNPTHHEINQGDPGDEDDHRFQCACGDTGCTGDNRDMDNIRIGAAWYSASCLMVTTKLAVIDALGYGERE
jgi:hypothetical protein